MTPHAHDTAASRAVFLVPKTSHIIRHCKFLLQGGSFFSKKNSNDMFFSNWNKEPDEEKNVSLNRVFSQVGQLQMKNAHGRTCKKTKVSIYLYVSLYENLFKNGYIYIYIYIIYTGSLAKRRCLGSACFSFPVTEPPLRFRTGN